jgi:hypothetical protein
VGLWFSSNGGHRPLKAQAWWEEGELRQIVPHVPACPMEH